MAVHTLGSPSFDPIILVDPVTPAQPVALEVVGGATNISVSGEVDPVFTAWDKSTGISITKSQVTDFGT